MEREGYTHLEEYEIECFDDVADNISVIKQAGAYSAVTFPGLFILKDIKKFCSPSASLDSFM
jgi:hypothetical protein